MRYDSKPAAIAWYSSNSDDQYSYDNIGFRCAGNALPERRPGRNIEICRRFPHLIVMERRHAQVDSAPPGNHRPCCDGDSCIRKQLDQLLDPAAPIVERIHVVACEVARTCGALNKEDLHSCAGKLFELTPECDLTELFVIAYQTERDALDGKRDIQHRYAAGLL